MSLDEDPENLALNAVREAWEDSLEAQLRRDLADEKGERDYGIESSEWDTPGLISFRQELRRLER